jgi:hypothetical protein
MYHGQPNHERTPKYFLRHREHWLWIDFLPITENQYVYATAQMMTSLLILDWWWRHEEKYQGNICQVKYAHQQIKIVLYSALCKMDVSIWYDVAVDVVENNCWSIINVWIIPFSIDVLFQLYMESNYSNICIHIYKTETGME